MANRRFEYSAFLLIALLAGCGPAENQTEQSPRRPNIVLLLADDWSYPHAGVYGDNTVSTPNFDALARGGMLFTNAYCASPSCSPSRASILTGRYPHQNGVAGNLWSEFPADLLTYPSLLAEAGYTCGYEQKGWAPGDWKASGRVQNPAGRQWDDLPGFLAAREPDQPFCYWFGTTDPHREYETNLGVLTGMKPDSVRVPPFFPDLPCVRNDIMDYYAEVERFDRHIGQVVALLRARGELENTLIIVSSDNGMPFPRAKATVYDAGARMPMVAHWPAVIPTGAVHEGYVNLASLAPTFLSAAGQEVPASMTLPSILPVLQSGAAAGAEEVLLERERHAQVRADSGSYAIRALRNDSFLYVRNYYPDRWPGGDPEAVLSVGAYGDVDNSITKMLVLAGVRPSGDTTDYFRLAFAKRPAEELYDLSRDPHQLQNIATSPGYAEIRRQYAKRLDGILKETNDPRANDPQTDFWDKARYTPSYSQRSYDRDAYIEGYLYKSLNNGVRFTDRSCLPGPMEQGSEE